MSLAFYPSADAWELMAQDQDLKLVFSGALTPMRWLEQRLGRLWRQAGNPWLAADVLDIYQLFSASARQAWLKAFWLAFSSQQFRINCLHLFLALLEESTIERIFRRLGTDAYDVRTLLKNYMQLDPTGADDAEIKQVPFAAFEESEKLHSRQITPLMLLVALMESLPADHILQAIFSNLGLTLTKLEVLAVWLDQLNYDFAPERWAATLLHCCQRLEWLERHNHIQFRLKAVEQALELAHQDSEKAQQLLIYAATAAKRRKLQTVTNLSLLS